MATQKKTIKPANKPLPKKKKNAGQSSWFSEAIAKYNSLISVLVIVVLGTLIYSNSFKCAFQFDDYNNIVDNVKIRNIADIKAWWNFYPTRPIGVFTFVLNYYFNQYDVTWYHIVNLFIHLVNSLLVWKIVLLIFAGPVMKDNKLAAYRKQIALFTALLFVSHPLATQSVTYIVQRMASQAAMFYLLSLVLYIQGRITGRGLPARYLLFGGAFLSAILAMLTKENAFTLPFAIILFELFFLQKKFPRINFRDYRVIAAMVVFIAIVCIIPLKVSFRVFHTIPPSLGHTYTLTPGNYLLTQFRVITTYIRLLLVPADQIVDYDYPISPSLFELKTLFSFLFLLVILIGGILLFRKNRVLSFGIFWFFLALSVESSFIPISDVIFEHRTYLPSFGFFLFFTSAAYLFVPRKYIILVPLAFTAIVAINSFFAHERNKVWENELTLWKDNVRKTPHKSRPYSNLGKALSHAGEVYAGLEAYNKSIFYNPGYADAWFNRGVSKGVLNDYAGAIADYTKAISLDSTNEYAYVNRGGVKTTLNDHKGAVEDYLMALKLDPDNPTTLFNCALSYHNLNDYPNSIRYYTRAITVQPGFVAAYLKRASEYESINALDSAFRDYAKAITLEPANYQSYFQRGFLYYRLEKYPEAVADLSKASELQPQAAEPFYVKGKLLAKTGNFPEAISCFTKALAVNPNYFDAWFDKALTEFSKGDYAGAINDFTQAIRVNPQSGVSYSNRGAAKFQGHDPQGACADWKIATAMGVADARSYLATYCK
jgi:protein O-mannosyl-transferase